MARLSSTDRGVVESALAELELATLLIRVGCRVRFLPESQARTADLECMHGEQRFFAEVTTMVESGRRSFGSRRRFPEEESLGDRPLFIDRILGRIAQKSRQLADYCAPVILAITVPSADGWPRHQHRFEGEDLDMRQLAGAVTVALPSVPQLSAVLISLWDVEPAQAHSPVRLANVWLVERSPSQTAYPRARLLILNHAAAAPFGDGEVKAFKELL
jgi:hypothetical protein